MSDTAWFGLEDVDHSGIKYVVLIAQYRGEYILIRNRNRTVWELPGGKREPDEQLTDAAARELHEETGAVRFTLTPFGIYRMNGSDGMIFVAEVEELGELPAFEIAEIRLSKTLPEGLHYGMFYYELVDKLHEWQVTQR